MKSNRITPTILFLLLTFSTFIRADISPKNYGGLSFNADKADYKNRTSYTIFAENKDWVKESLKIEFDLSLFDNQMIGHILTCKSDKVELFNMFVAKYNNPQVLTINLNLTFAGKSIALPIDIKTCGYNIWHNISICIEPKRGYARLQIGNIIREINFSSKQVEARCKYTFGLCDHYLNISPFAIKNLLYEGDRTDKAYFPLDEVSGNTAYNEQGDPIGHITNPQWLHPKHYHWELIEEMEETEVVAIFHDKSTANLVIYSSTGSHIYSLRNAQMTTQKHNFAESFKFVDSGGLNYIFNDTSGNLFMYNNNQNETNYTTATYNYKQNSLKIHGNSSFNNRLHHNAVFSNQENSKVYQFGGYGLFKYHNTFYAYDFVSNAWKVEPFTGDTICPRFYTSVATDFREGRDHAYLFGGYGNNSGIQAEGGKYLYDLYQINLDKQLVKKVINFDVDFSAVPCRNMILSDDEKSFHTLCYAQYKPESAIALYNFNWDTGKHVVLTDSIPLVSREIVTRVHLFEDNNTNVLICAVQEYTDLKNSKIRLYRLLSPPTVSGSVLQSRASTNKGFKKQGIILSVLSVLLLLSGLYAVYTKRSKRQTNPAAPEEPSNLDESICNPTKAATPILNNIINSTYLLGEFTVINRSGKDISYLFSAKIRQLFLLILLYTVRDTSKSISSNELSAILWPDKDSNKAKNSRGVGIKHLRDILTELDGISLVHSNSKWFFEIDPALFYCDYIWFINNSTTPLKADDIQHDDIKSHIAVLRRGGLLSAVAYTWLDPFKAEHEEKVIQHFYPIMLSQYNKQQYQLAYKLAQLVKIYDPLNENVVKVEVKSLVNLGDSVKAKVRFRQFALDYYYACNKNLNYQEFIS